MTGRHPASRTRATWSARPPQVGVVDGAFGRGERGGAYLDDQAPPAPRTGPSRRMRSRRHRSSLLERVGRRSARLERERAAQDAYLVAVPRARALERLVHPQGASGGAAKTARPPRSPSRSAPPCAPPAGPSRGTRRRRAASPRSACRARRAGAPTRARTARRSPPRRRAASRSSCTLRAMAALRPSTPSPVSALTR